MSKRTDWLYAMSHLQLVEQADTYAKRVEKLEARRVGANVFLVPGTDMVGMVYFAKAGGPRCTDCDGWAIGMAVQDVHGEDVEIPVCAVDGFHRAADGQRIRRFEDEDRLTRSRYK
jgi:hypothetical protein